MTPDAKNDLGTNAATRTPFGGMLRWRAAFLPESAGGQENACTRPGQQGLGCSGREVCRQTRAELLLRRRLGGEPLLPFERRPY